MKRDLVIAVGLVSIGVTVTAAISFGIAAATALARRASCAVASTGHANSWNENY